MPEDDENQNQGTPLPVGSGSVVLPPAEQMPLAVPLDKIAKWYSGYIQQSDTAAEPSTSEEAGEEGAEKKSDDSE